MGRSKNQEARRELHSIFLYATRLLVRIFHIQIICVMHHPDLRVHRIGKPPGSGRLIKPHDENRLECPHDGGEKIGDEVGLKLWWLGPLLASWPGLSGAHTELLHARLMHWPA